MRERADRLQPENRSGAPAGAPIASHFQRSLHFEEDAIYRSNLPLDGDDEDRWYWRRFCATDDFFCWEDNQFDVVAPAVSSVPHTATLTLNLHGDTSYICDLDHQVQPYVNGELVGTGDFDGTEEYAESFHFESNHLNPGPNALELYFPEPGECDGNYPDNSGYINFFEIAYLSDFIALDDALAFGGDMPGVWQYQAQSFSDADITVLDVSNRQRPVWIEDAVITGSGPYQAAFQADNGVAGGARFYAAAASGWKKPLKIIPDTPSDLHSPANGADYLIITHNDFLAQAQQLADYRAATDHFRTTVVDVQDIYDEFNGGLMDAETIREFIIYASSHWQSPRPQYVVLMGNGHYDFHDNLGTGEPMLIPPYLAVVDPVFGEAKADNRYVDIFGDGGSEGGFDGMPDLYLGRFPVKTVAEAQEMVERIIAYETSPPAEWQKRAVFVASGADPGQANQIAEHIWPYPESIRKIYYGNNYNSGSDMRTAILDSIEQGALLVSYWGGGNRIRWDKNSLAAQDFASLRNSAFPVILSFTSRWEPSHLRPFLEPMAERSVATVGGGAVASLFPTGRVSDGISHIAQGFYEALQGGEVRLGKAVSAGKQALFNNPGTSQEALDLYLVYGDPALRVRMPGVADLEITKDDGDVLASPGDTLVYTLTYRNVGNELAVGVTITETVPAHTTFDADASGPWWSCAPDNNAGSACVLQFGTVPAGGSGTLTFAVTVDDPLPAGIVEVANTAMIGIYGGLDPTPENNQHEILTPLAVGAIGNFIFADINTNGVQDPADTAGISGIPITLTKQTTGETWTTVSDTNGFYTFTKLAPGVYHVEPPASIGVFHRTTAAPVEVSLALGQIYVDADFGYFPSGGAENDYKIVTEESGLYQVTYADLLAGGFNPAGIDTNTFQLFNHDEEVAFLLFDGNDGSFDVGDYFLFYAEEKVTRYTSHDVYWLVAGENARLQPVSKDGSPAGAPLAANFQRTLHFEEDLDYQSDLPLNGDDEDRWYWRYFCGIPGRACRDFEYNHPFDVTLPAVSSEEHTANLAIALRGESPQFCDPDHQVQPFINDIQLGDSYFDGQAKFTGSYDFNSTHLSPGLNTVRLYFPLLDCDGGNATNKGYINYFAVTYLSDFSALDDALDFGGEAPGVWQYQIDDFATNDIIALDVSDPRRPIWLQDVAVNGSGPYQAAFEADNGVAGGAQFYAAANSAWKTPVVIYPDLPSDLRSPDNGADYLIITHGDFSAQAQQLAAYRATTDGFRTAVVDVQDIYDEFNGGLMDAEVIREFIYYASRHWQPPGPQYVVLLGNGHFDFHDNLEKGEPMFIPPYLAAVDPFQGETAADNRYVDIFGDEQYDSDGDDVFTARNIEIVDGKMALSVDFGFHNDTTAQGSGHLAAQTAPDAPELVKAIGDRVFWDEDRDGVWDGNEVGVPGVTVQLWREGGLIETQITDEGGKYFFEDIASGVYQVEFIPPDGFEFTAKNADPDNDYTQGESPYDSDADPVTGVTDPITYTYPETPQSHWDAGLMRPGTIGNRVWEDLNGDGLQDDGESGIADVEVNLLQNGVVIATTTTDATGHYFFFEVADGVYDVQIAASSFDGPLAGYTASPQDQGFDGLPDLHLGRFPVKTVVQAQEMVDRVAAYESSPLGEWQQRALFVADNTDAAGDFSTLADEVADDVWPYPESSQKIYYLENYPTPAAMKTAIMAGIDQGALLVSYWGS